MSPRSVTTTYLEQRSPDRLRPAVATGATVTRVGDVAPEFARFLYTAVGGDWHWTDRLGWSRQRWVEHLSRTGVETHVAWVDDAPAGLVELVPAGERDGTATEITSFGLLPHYVGRGLGGDLLTRGVRAAWSLHERHEIPPVNRVWLHTCTLDGPHALANYQARGFEVYDTRTHDQEVADAPPGPWPGA